MVHVLDSDDEITPDALSMMLSVVDGHPDIDAVTCNCRDAVTGRFCGTGLDHDAYVDMRTFVRMTGEHWGITKTRLLGSRRFDERLPGLEGVLWLKLSAGAHRFYVHQALRIYHTEGDDRVSIRNEDRTRQLSMYESLVDDGEYLSLLERVDPEGYSATLYRICLACVVAGRRRESWRILHRYTGPWKRRVFLMISCALGRRWVTTAYAIKDRATGAQR